MVKCFGEFGTPFGPADFGAPPPPLLWILRVPPARQIQANKRTQKRLGKAAKAGPQKQLKLWANEFIKAIILCQMCDNLRPIIEIMLRLFKFSLF